MNFLLWLAVSRIVSRVAFVILDIHPFFHQGVSRDLIGNRAGGIKLFFSI